MKVVLNTLLLAAVAMAGVAAWAQTEYPKVEVGADFSLVVFNPSKRLTTSHNVFGGGGNLTYNVNRFLGIKMDLQGYGSQANSFIIPVGTRIGPVTTVNPLAFTANGNLFTYLFGPQFKHHGKFEPFAQALFGGAHSNVYGNAFRLIGTSITGIGAAPSNNGFGMLVGGGLDFAVSHSIALRPAEVGYLLTRFGNNITGSTSTQNNFRYSAGIVFRFGSGGQ